MQLLEKLWQGWCNMLYFDILVLGHDQDQIVLHRMQTHIWMGGALTQDEKQLVLSK